MKIKLLVVRGQPRDKALLFPPGEFIIGRGEECHLRPNSSWVSRQHCLLKVVGDGAALRDLGSRNGTLINGVRVVSERRLASGDLIQVGPLVFQVSFEEAGANGHAGEVLRCVDANRPLPMSEEQPSAALQEASGQDDTAPQPIPHV